MIETLIAIILWLIQPEILIAWMLLALIVALVISSAIKSADDAELMNDADDPDF